MVNEQRLRDLIKEELGYVPDKDTLKILSHSVGAIQTTFRETLNYIEILGLPQDQFKRLRARVLGLGNDQIRMVIREVAENFRVKHVPKVEDLVEFDQ